MTYPKPPKTNLEDALEEIIGNFDTWCMCGQRECVLSENFAQAKEQITNLFVSQFLEIVGEDEPEVINDNKYIYDQMARNELREQLRTQIKDTIGRMGK